MQNLNPPENKYIEQEDEETSRKECGRYRAYAADSLAYSSA